MDAKVFRLAIITIISAFVLVMVIIYATNAQKINELLGLGQEKNPVVAEEASDESSKDQIIYGDQIGDDLDAFTLDESFFDEDEEIPAVVVIKRNNSSSSDTAEDGSAISDSGSEAGTEDEYSGTGMAVVGELHNPNAYTGTGTGAMGSGAATSSSGYLTSLPDAPAGGYGQYIPPSQTVTGTQVGTP